MRMGGTKKSNEPPCRAVVHRVTMFLTHHLLHLAISPFRAQIEITTLLSPARERSGGEFTGTVNALTCRWMGTFFTGVLISRTHFSQHSHRSVVSALRARATLRNRSSLLWTLLYTDNADDAEGGDQDWTGTAETHRATQTARIDWTLDAAICD